MIIQNIRRIFLLIAFAVIALPVSAQLSEDECPDKDLSDQFGPIRNQGHSGQCYAFVAADLIGFNQKISPKNMVSALDVAVNYISIDPKLLYKEAHSLKDWQLSSALSLVGIPALERKRESWAPIDGVKKRADGGIPIVTLAAYNQIGTACLEQNYPSQAPSVDLFKNEYINYKLAAASGAAGTYFPIGGLVRRPILPKTFEEEPLYRRCLNGPKSLDEFKSFNKQFDEQVINQVKKDNTEKCGSRIPLKPMEYGMLDGNQTKESSLAKYTAQLLKKEIPIGLVYDSSFLVDGRNADIQPSSHASSVVGSRWNKNTKTCEFKLRNSWGPLCDSYAAEFKKSCEPKADIFGLPMKILTFVAVPFMASHPRNKISRHQWL